eukprot:CAMPEP_0178420544 /NCGR_PEP_ID=MMETSP0689_2-20121128/26187_1 /TAXON_ID=160604 /ORGANISM="Amphidinium massartii, Strain CS-259" /LENGTH=128 /DNA_ID=CAMNT_0020042029 /DNA_START=352 /DNA_END=734 /DNA_ORIENTATION=-
MLQSTSADALVEVDGITPLHIASSCGHIAVVRTLLKHRADPHLGTAVDGRTAVYFAMAAGNIELAEILRASLSERTMEAESGQASGKASSVEDFLARQNREPKEYVPRMFQNARLEELRQRIVAREKA